MKKVILFSTCIAAAATMAACGGPGAKGKAAADTAAAETKAVPEYTVINNATVDLAGFPQDKDGYYVQRLARLRQRPRALEMDDRQRCDQIQRFGRR